MKKTELTMKLDLKLMSAVKKHIMDKFILMCKRIKDTSPEIEISPKYYESELKFEYKTTEENEKLELFKNFSQLNESTEEHFQIQKYVSIVHPDSKLKRNIKKVLNANRLKRLIKDDDVEIYLNTPTSITDKIKKLKTSRDLCSMRILQLIFRKVI
jgi:hypothetical protein